MQRSIRSRVPIEAQYTCIVEKMATSASASSSSLYSVSAENCSSAVDSVVEETSSSERKTENGRVRTILNTLKSPAPSQLARKRKIHSNPPTGVKRRTTTVKTDYEPKSVTPTSRAREFPGEYLTASGGNLFCSACREPVSLKKSIIK